MLHLVWFLGSLGPRRAPGWLGSDENSMGKNYCSLQLNLEWRTSVNPSVDGGVTKSGGICQQTFASYGETFYLLHWELTKISTIQHRHYPGLWRARSWSLLQAVGEKRGVKQWPNVIGFFQPTPPSPKPRAQRWKEWGVSFAGGHSSSSEPDGGDGQTCSNWLRQKCPEREAGGTECYGYGDLNSLINLNEWRLEKLE